MNIKRGAAKFYDTNSTDPIHRVRRLQVRSFSDGAAIQYEDGEPVPLTLVGEALEGPWEKLQIVGSATLRIWREDGGPLSTFTAPPSGTTVFEKGAAVAVPTAATQLLQKNAARRSLGLQNQGVNAVKVCSDAGCTQVMAVLAPCVAAYDGSGGTFSLNGYTGPLYAIAVGAAADVSVVAY